MTKSRLLLVEDNTDTTDMLSAFFTVHEFQVLVARKEHLLPLLSLEPEFFNQ